jgi:tellurite resistance protein TerC
MGLFKYLKASLVFVLAFVGVKMLVAGVYHIDAILSLFIILGILGVGVLASLLARKPAEPATTDDGSMPHA